MLYLLVFATMMFSCRNEEKEMQIPEHILTPEQMTALLVDFHLVEASVVQSQQAHEDINQLTNYRYNFVLEKHKTSRRQFTESLQFYNQNLKELKKIYENVVIELNTTQSRISSK